MEIYQHVINLFPQVLTTGSIQLVHVLPCLCDNACKKSLVICHKSRALCPAAGCCLYSLHVLNRDVNMIQTKVRSSFLIMTNMLVRCSNSKHQVPYTVSNPEKIRQILLLFAICIKMRNGNITSFESHTKRTLFY